MKKILLTLSLLSMVHAVTVEQLFNVKTVKVKRETVEMSKTYNGYAEIADDRVYSINLTHDGFVRKVHANRAYIHQGSKVEVTFNGDEHVYHAIVDFIYPIVDKVNKTIDFRITLKNQKGTIQPNAYATIKTISTTQDRIVLPITSVLTKGSRHIVFLPSKYEGEYESREIEAKRISSSKFEVLSGLKEGDVVVNNSLFLIDSDVAINGED